MHILESVDHCKTPRALYECLKETLEWRSLFSPKELEDTVNIVRPKAIGFRNSFRKLPSIPPARSNPMATLQDIMQWCIDADQVVDSLVGHFDSRVLSGIITLLQECEQLDAPLPSKDTFGKVMDKVDEIMKRHERKPKRRNYTCHWYYAPNYRSIWIHHAVTIKEVVGLLYLRKDMEVSFNRCFKKQKRLAQNERRNGTEKQRHDVFFKDGSIEKVTLKKKYEDVFLKSWDAEYYRIVLRICRLLDINYRDIYSEFESTYNTWLAEMNRLLGTPTGKQLSIYAKLKGLEFFTRWRHLSDDKGLLRIVDFKLHGEAVNSWRFDCFSLDPYYHLPKPRDKYLKGMIGDLERILRSDELKPLLTDDKGGEAGGEGDDPFETPEAPEEQKQGATPPNTGDEREGGNVSFAPGQLQDSLSISATTLNQYAKDAGVPTPGRGKRNFLYPKNDVIKILHQMGKASEQRLRQRSTQVLRTLKSTDI